MNDKFVTLAGNTSVWDAEMASLKDRGQSLVDLQVSQSARGYTPISLYKTIYGWSIRYASGLQGFEILFSSRGGVTRAEAIKSAIDWVNKNPDIRHFYVFKADLEIVDPWEKLEKA